MLLRLAPPAKLFPPKEREWHPKTSPLPLYRPNLSRFGTTPRASTTSTSSSSSSSGYRKVPLGTPGAYRLIDDDTGESVIIWGDPDEERFPPKEALFSAPSSSSSSAANSPSTASGGAAAVGKFTKLKAHKVRALLARSSRGREDSSLDREGYGSSSVKSAELDCDYESETEEEEEGEGEENDPFEARDHVVSRSNFLEVLREEGEDGLLEGDSDRVSLLSSSSSSPGSVRKGGWAVDTGHTDRSKQRKRKEPFVKDDGGFFSRRSFKELGCSDDIIEALRKQEFVRPSHIQALSYAQILEGKTCVIADQSGSGKTLAYLAPLVQCLRQEEIRGIAKSTPKNPRVVILAPTAELASQVLNNCRSLSKNGVPFRSIVATGGFRQKTQLKGLQQELDVLIATPGRSLYLLKEGFLELANLKSVVLDEVDILFSDKDFEEVLQNLITCAPVMTQYLFVTATLPVDIYNKLVEVFPDSEVIMGPGMHRTSSGLEEVLVDCSGDGEEKNPDTAFANKKSSLLHLLEESPGYKTIVFCNKIETCRKVENALKRYDRKGSRIKVLPFHSALDQEFRLSNLKEFLDTKTSNQLVLVCTDRASRGIDFRAVDHVVLFDFPRDPSEYVRRVGRAARGAGGKGKAFVFVVGKQVSLARRIIERNEKGHPLHDVPC